MVVGVPCGWFSYVCPLLFAFVFEEMLVVVAW